MKHDQNSYIRGSLYFSDWLRDRLVQAHAFPRRSTSDTTTLSAHCTYLVQGDMVISRAAFTVSVTICVFATCISLVIIAALLYREHCRRRQSENAKIWGRQSHVNARMSVVGKACKAIDDDYSTQYRGCLMSIPENPEMGSDSPIEIMQEERLWEAPAVPAKVIDPRRDRRKSRVRSLFFDHGVGLWMPKR